MQIQNKQQIFQYISRAVEEVDERAEEEKAKEKLNSILSSEQADRESVEIIQSFISSSAVNSQKLYAFCTDFVDPTFHPQTAAQKGEEVENHVDLRRFDLFKLMQFIERHKWDGSFAETVYKIMDEHNMTPPQVYNNVLMRRQDFSRVTSARCENITRRMVWQVIIGLRCNLEEADRLLFSAGYVRKNSALDLTMQYFIEHEDYDIISIDQVLDELGERPYTR